MADQVEPSNIFRIEDARAKRIVKQILPNAEPKVSNLVSEVLGIFLSLPPKDSK